MTEEQWKRVQEIVRTFRPGGITTENFEDLLPEPVQRPPEPATARQINYLKALRYMGPTKDLGKQEACRLIAGLVKERQ
jgi:hypothetical protein